MKIGTLLAAAIVSLSAVGGGLAVYVAVSKYQTMDKVAVARSRLEVVRAVGEIPRYMNPERGFATNILYGPATVDPKARAELDEKYRKQTDGARNKINAIRKNLSGTLDDGAAVGSAIDALNSKFAALRDAIDKAIDGPAVRNANITGVQRAADDTGSAANQVLGAAEQLSSQSRDLAGQVNRFLSEVRAA
jgi:phage-related tail protein